MAPRRLPELRGAARRPLPEPLPDAAQAARDAGVARRPRLAAATVPNLQGNGRANRALPRAGDQRPGRTPPVLPRAREELHALEDVWRALERAGATLALVRFCGGAGRHGTLEAISIRAGERELAHWRGAAASELAGALAAPVWGRYGTFRGQPRIAATLTWSVTDRSLLLAGTRGSEHFHEILNASSTPARTLRDTSRDTSLDAGDAHQRSHEPDSEKPQPAGRACCRCGQPIPANARPEARYCSKRCRQRASRARLREQSGRAGLAAPELCAWCDGPMPTGLRPEARYCGKRCRQAASRARLTSARVGIPNDAGTPTELRRR